MTTYQKGYALILRLMKRTSSVALLVSFCAVAWSGEELGDAEGLFRAALGKDDASDVAELLDTLVAQNSGPACSTLIASRLNFESPLYAGRDKFESIRLRSYVFASLARLPVPDEAVPHALETIRHSRDPVSRAAACRMAAKLGARGSGLVPAIARIACASQRGVPVALHQYSQAGPVDENWTTDRIEAVRALGSIGGDLALQTLRDIVHFSRGRSEARFISEAKSAIEKMPTGNRATGNLSAESKKFSPAKSVQAIDNMMKFMDHCGNEIRGKDLLGSPCVLVFFYTGCDNPARCSQNVDTMIRFRRLLDDENGSDMNNSKVRLCLITLEPERDTPTILHRYGKRFDFPFSNEVMILKPAESCLRTLEASLKLPVSRCCNVVTNHGVTWYLVDKSGSLVGRYEVDGRSDTFRPLLDAVRRSTEAE